MRVVRSQSEIDKIMERCQMADENGSVYPSMTYEEGVEYAIRWLTEEGADPIFESEN